MTKIDHYVFLLDLKSKDQDQKLFTTHCFSKFIREFSDKLDHMRSHAEILVSEIDFNDDNEVSVKYSVYDRKYMVGDWINEGASLADNIFEKCIFGFEDYYIENMKNVDLDRVAIISLIDTYNGKGKTQDTSHPVIREIVEETHNITIPFSNSKLLSEEENVWECYYEADYFIDLLDKYYKGAPIHSLKMKFLRPPRLLGFVEKGP